MTTRILLVDDHALFSQGLRLLLDGESRMEIVGEAMSGQECIEIAAEQLPDIVLMDLSMPVMNGMEATRLLAAEVPTAKVICLSMHSGRRFVLAALDAGARGYVLKGCELEDLHRAIRAVSAGEVYLSSGIAAVVVDAYRAGHSEVETSAFSLLTDRERSVLQLLAEGDSTRKIAQRLGISPKTVATHREHLMQKLAIDGVAGLTRYAIREGLTTSDE